MTSREFWNHVAAKEAELRDEHKARVARFQVTKDEADLQGQPKDGRHIYIVSIRNLERGVEAGAVCEANYHLAAQREVENTHRVATAAQIEEFLAQRKAHQDEISRTNMNRLAHNAALVINAGPAVSTTR